MTRERLIGGLIVLAIAALAAWIAHNTTWETREVRSPPRGEALTNPFFVAQRLTRELGVSSEWDRALIDPPPPNTVLALSNWNWDLSDTRREALMRWVEAGGRLLVDSSLYGSSDDFDEWTGITQQYIEEPDLKNTELHESCRALKLIRGTSSSDPQRAQYVGCGLEKFSYLESDAHSEWQLVDETGVQAMRVRIGAGSVSWYNGALVADQPRARRALLEGETAAVFVDAVKLRRGDHVVFATEHRSASLLELIWQYGAPAVWLLLLIIGLALWRNSLRIGPFIAPAENARRSLAEQIRGTGQFIFKTSGASALHAAIVRALHEAAQRRIPDYASLSHHERIARIAQIATLDPEVLAAKINFGAYRRAAEFRESIAMLEYARKRVLALDTHSVHTALAPNLE